MTIGAIRLNTEIEMQQNSRVGVAFFPAVQPRAMPRRYGASYRRGGLKRWPLLVLEPSARTIAAWHRRTNVWHKATSPCEGAKRLRNRTANDGYSDEKMCPMSRKTRIRCRLTALIVVYLIFPIPAANAQIEAKGDVWSSREERVYIPQEALELPDAIAPGDIEMATGDVWPSRKKQMQIPQEALVPNNLDNQAARTNR